MKKPAILKDINSKGNSNPKNLTDFNGKLVFTATEKNQNTGFRTRGLWLSDGTPDGTQRIKTINTYQEAHPYNFHVGGDKLFFVADDGIHGAELWRSDGTEDETLLIKDINSNEESSLPRDLTYFKNQLYFTADDGIHGRQLWKTDGNITEMVTDLFTGGTPIGQNSGIIAFNNHLYFEADDGSGRALWKSDGSAKGTSQIFDAYPNSDSHSTIDNLVVSGNKLYFSSSDPVYATELYTTDGTASGTGLVKDINTRTGSSIHAITVDLVDLKGKLYFNADDGSNGKEIWATDGTEKGTFLAYDIYPNGSGRIDGIIDVNGSLFFAASDGIHGKELWITEGDLQQTSGASLVKDIAPGNNGAFEPDWKERVAVNNSLYFKADDGSSGFELWASDGSEEGTELFDLWPGAGSSSPQHLTRVNNTLYFSADDGSNGTELWSLAANSLYADNESAIIKEGATTTNLDLIDGDIDTANQGRLTIDSVNGKEFNSLANSKSLTYQASQGFKEVEGENGTLYIQSNGSSFYKHDGSDSSVDSFDYIAKDSEGNQTNGASATIFITAIDDTKPIAISKEEVIAKQSSSGNLALLTQATDSPDNSPLQVHSINGLEVSSLSESSSATYSREEGFKQINLSAGILYIHTDGSCFFVHNGSDELTDSFNFVLKDSAGNLSDSESVSISILSTDRISPQADNEVASIRSGATSNNLDLLTGDFDVPSNPLIISSVNGTNFASLVDSSSVTYRSTDDYKQVKGDEGILYLKEDGTAYYVHDGANSDSDNFSYSVKDPSGNESNPASISIEISLFDETPPTADNENINVKEGAISTNIDILNGDSDQPDSKSLKIESIDGTSFASLASSQHTDYPGNQGFKQISSSNGTLLVKDDGTAYYQHNHSNTTSDSFYYHCIDPAGNVSNPASISISVIPIDDTAPIADDEETTLDAGESSINLKLLKGDTDYPDNSSLTIHSVQDRSLKSFRNSKSSFYPWNEGFKQVSGNSGILYLKPDGTAHYVHNGSAAQSDSFTYTTIDAAGNTSNTASITISITPPEEKTYQTIESSGESSLLLGADNFLYAQFISAEEPSLLRKNGKAIKAPSNSSKWEALGVEELTGTKTLAMKNNKSNHLSLWEFDEAWSFTTRRKAKNNSNKFLQAESGFHQDFNNDMITGYNYTEIESNGNTTFLSDNFRRLYISTSGSEIKIPITKQNNPIKASGKNAKWQKLGAETIDGENSIVVKNRINDRLQIWQFNADWSYEGKSSIRANSRRFGEAEQLFSQDFNDNLIIGE